LSLWQTSNTPRGDLTTLPASVTRAASVQAEAPAVYAGAQYFHYLCK
jgi:hypothetical protein